MGPSHCVNIWKSAFERDQDTLKVGTNGIRKRKVQQIIDFLKTMHIRFGDFVCVSLCYISEVT